MKTSLKAVIFDLDGTLIHSAPDLTVALNKLLIAHGRTEVSVPDVTLMIGDGVQKLVERGFEATGPAVTVADLPRLTAEFLTCYDGHEADLTKPYPGVVAALDRLRARGLKLAVCTNKPHAASVEILKALALDGYFDAVVGGDSVTSDDGAPVRKPDGAHVLAALTALGVGIDETAMVGDSPNDIAAARNAALSWVVVVSYGYTRIAPVELDGDVLIDHFEDIPGALDARA